MLRRSRRQQASAGGAPHGERSYRRRWLICLLLGAGVMVLPLVVLALNSASCDHAAVRQAGATVHQESSFCAWRSHLALQNILGAGDHILHHHRATPPPPPPAASPTASQPSPPSSSSPSPLSPAPLASPLPSPTPSPSPSASPLPSPTPSPSPVKPPSPRAAAEVAQAANLSQRQQQQGARADAQKQQGTGAKAGAGAEAGAGAGAGGGKQHGQKYVPVVAPVVDETTQLPETDEDVERIMKFPHVDECNTCKVCVPHYVVAKHPLAIERAKKLAHILFMGDPLEEVSRDSRPQLWPGHSQPAKKLVTQGQGTATSRRQLRSFQHRLLGAFKGMVGRGEGVAVGGGGEGEGWLVPVHEASSLGWYERYERGDDEGYGAGGGLGVVGEAAGQLRTQGRGGDDEEEEEEEEDWSETGEQGRREGGSGSGSGQEGAPRQQQRQRGGQRGGGGGRALQSAETLDSLESNETYYFRGQPIDISEIAPGNVRAPKRKHLDNCTVCWGCKHVLEPMASGDMFFDSYYAHEPGGSPSWLFQVRTNKTDSGWAVVKVWCVPVQKVKQRGLAMCSPKKVYSQVKLLLAQQQVTAKCGLNDIVPKLWIEHVHGVLPGHGFRVDWMGMWFDIADGVSVQNIQEAGKPPVQPELMLDMLSKNINHTEIKLGAIFDLLFSQCDRHQQNIFMTEKGQLRFIDNDQVYGTAWRKCGIDSMIVPTTQKFMINHLGFFYVLKYPHKNPGPPRKWSTLVSPLLLLDYRCHVGKDGKIGINFPPMVRQCMVDLAAMTADQIHWEYGYPALRMADAVRNRSRDMLLHGYEWTLMHGEPTNQPMHRYKVAPSCCNMTFDATSKKFACTTPGYHQMTELPYGNPWHGGKWHGAPGNDTGTYVGGTVFR